LEDRVHVRVGLDVVEADETGVVGLLAEVERGRGGGVDLLEERGREGWVEEVLDVVERRVIDFVAVGENVNLSLTPRVSQAAPPLARRAAQATPTPRQELKKASSTRTF